MIQKRRINPRNQDEKKKEPVRHIPNPTTLQAINKIVEMVRDSKLSEDFFSTAAHYLKVMMKKQDISEIQCVLLSLIAEATSMDNHASLADIANFTDCNGIEIMQYKDEIDDLTKRGFLQKIVKFNDCVEYVVTVDCMKALAYDMTFVRQSYAGCTGVSFFQTYYRLTHERFENRMSTEVLKLEFQRLCEDNPELPYVVALRSLDLNIMSEMILTQMCRHLVVNNEADLPVESLSFLYDSRNERTEYENSLNSGCTELQLRDLIDNSCSDGFCSKDEYSLTENSHQLLLKDFDIKPKQKKRGYIISCKDITQKSLFFGQEVLQQLDELYALLDEEHYQSIRSRLKEKGLRQGFTCLFYGEPGTGKTESVLQLAQKTGRDLVQVNISDIKSMWVGESEKNIKGVFSRYRTLVQNSKRTPILLFNEADSIIGKRKEGAERSVDRMENSIQNIILQEMETLEGIMIATTNLVQNMDSAFERRFLYKVRFVKPLLEQRIQIWRSMMPDLNEETVSRLASVYDFSGGQIENIARKCNVESILYGQETVNDEKVEQYCKEERIIVKGNHRIGFRI